MGLGTESLAAGGYGGSGGEGDFCKFLEKKAVLIPLDHISHVFKSQPFERTRILTFQSQSKKFNCLILLLRAIKFQNTLKILYYGVKF